MARGLRTGRAFGRAAIAVLALAASATPARAAGLPSPSVTFLTVHEQPGGGELRRATTTLIDVPTPLRVDAGASLDLLATAVVLSTSRVGIVIDRLPGSRAPLPASVEAIVRDPTGGDLGRQRIAVGYDARRSSAPRRFRATALLSVGGDPNHFAVQQVVGGASEGLATIAELFDPGPAGTRLRPERIAIGFAPVASSVRVDATLASPRIAVGVTTSGPTAATIDGTLDDGAGVQSLHAVVDRLPDAVSVAYTEDGGLPSLVYDAGAPIASIRARYEHRVGGELREAATAAVDDLPGHLSFALTAPTAGNLHASAPIGQVEIAAARNGEPVGVAGTQPGVRLDRHGDFASFAVRLRGLQDARVDAGRPIAVDATIARQPFSVAIDDRVSRLRVSGAIADLPARLSLRVDLPGGAIVYDGHGATIGRIALVARGRFGALRRIAATIDRLPTGAVRFATRRKSPTRIEFAAARPLGAVDLVATSGRAPPRVPAGRDVVYYRDVRGAFIAHVRVTGLRGVTFAAPPAGRRGPVVASLARVSRRPVHVDVRARFGSPAKAPLVVKGRLVGLPDRMRLRLEGRRGLHAAYDGSAPIGAIHLSVRGGGLPALARRVRLDVRDLPRRLRVDQSRAGKVVEATADRPVGSLSVAVASRGEPRPVAGSGSGLRIAGGSLALRLRGLRRVVVRTAVPLRLDATLARQRFAVTVDDARSGVLLRGTIADLPARLSATVDLPHGTIAYDGHGDTIQRIALEASARRALFARARRVAVTIAGLPSGVRVRLDRRGGSFAFDASRPLGLVDVSASDGAPVPPARGDGVFYRDLPGLYALRVRLTGMQRVAYAPDPVSVAFERAGALPVAVDVRTALPGGAGSGGAASGSGGSGGAATGSGGSGGASSGGGAPLVLTGSLAGLPRTVRVTLARAGAGLRAEYAASSRLRALHLHASGGPLPVHDARLDVLDLPRRLVVSVPGDGTFDARADGGVGSLGVAVADRGAARQVAGSGPGLRVVTDGPKAGIAVRLLGLRRIELLDASPLAFRATLARQPLAFTVDLPRAGQRLTGEIDQLPSRVGLRIGAGASTIDYDGGGERIERIAFAATARRPLFAGARRVAGTITGFPSGRLVLRRDRAAVGRFAFTASQPIGQIDVTASDDGSPVPAGDVSRDRVLYRDVRGRYAVGVRVSGLRRVAFAAGGGASGPVTATIGRSSARPIDVDVRTVIARGKAPLVLTGGLTGLPSDLTLGLRTAGGVHASYRASGPLRSLRVTATGTPLPPRVRRVTFAARDVPERMDLRLAPGTSRVVFDASRPIGQLRLVATDGCGAVPGFRDGADGLYYRDLRSRFAVRAQLTGLRRVDYTASPLAVTVARPGGRRVRLDLLTQRAGEASAGARSRCPKPEAPARSPSGGAASGAGSASGAGAGSASGAGRASAAGSGSGSASDPASRAGSDSAGGLAAGAGSASSGPKPLRLQGSLEGLPAVVRVSAAATRNVRVGYAASGPLRSLALLVRGLGASGRRSLVVRTKRVPRRFDVDYREVRCGGTSPPCGAFVRTGEGGSPIGEVVFKLTGTRFLALKRGGDRLVAQTGDTGIEVSARLSNLRRLDAEVLRTPFRLVLATGGGAAQPPILIDTQLASPSAKWRGALAVTLRDVPKLLRVCFDRGPVCAESRERAANSLLIEGDERPGADPVDVRAVLCFKQVRRKDCSGPESARLVLVTRLQKLGIEVTPTENGYVFVNTAPRGGGGALPISGDIGYFSGDRQHVCFKLGAGAKFNRRKYFRPPPGSRSYGEGGGRAISTGHGEPAIVCDADHTPDGFTPRAMPGIEVPTGPIAELADDD